MANAVNVTAVDSGYFEVMLNGVKMSQHSQWWKALAAAANLELADSTDEVMIHQVLQLRVEGFWAFPAPPSPVA